jgi:hypothetical protein
VEPYLADCAFALEAWRSGYNGKVILRAARHADFDWDMESSDTDFMFASGAIGGDLPQAEARLRMLSAALGKANFPHQLKLDSTPGVLRASIAYAWPPGQHVVAWVIAIPSRAGSPCDTRFAVAESAKPVMGGQHSSEQRSGNRRLQNQSAPLLPQNRLLTRQLEFTGNRDRAVATVLE